MYSFMYLYRHELCPSRPLTPSTALESGASAPGRTGGFLLGDDILRTMCIYMQIKN